MNFEAELSILIGVVGPYGGSAGKAGTVGITTWVPRVRYGAFKVHGDISYLGNILNIFTRQ